MDPQGSMERVDTDNSPSISLDYGSIAEVNDAELRDLIQCVHNGKLNDTKTKLSKFLLFSSGGYSKPVLVRAKVYSRLIAVALGLRPQDISRREESDDDVPKTESQREFIEFISFRELFARREGWVDDGRIVLRYLLKDVLEEDDDVMTVIFCDLEYFKTCPVPYFPNCDLNLIEQVSRLWLTNEILETYYFDPLIDPIVETVKLATINTDKNFIKAKLMLCEHLQQRRLKAGARLFYMVTARRQVQERQAHDSIDMVGELVKEIFNIKARANSFEDYSFLFLKWENYWYNLDILDDSITDRVYDGHGQSICVGPLPSGAHTDSNLLCWAARRGYSSLIWCVMQSYKPVSKSDIDYWTEYAWKYALWCAIRHGDNWSVIRELSAPVWTHDIDFNDYPSGWLPPLHLAALLGDMDRIESLCKFLQDVKLCANKKDYLGRTPLDYAMQFKITTSRIKQLFSKSSKKVKDYETLRHKDVVKKLLQMDGVGERLKELYDMYIHQANNVLIGAALIASVTFAGWLQPPLGYTDYYQFTQPVPSPPAPNGTIHYQSYVVIEGHVSMEVFVVFNSLSFFLAIATMLVGAEATLFIHDNDERTSALIRMRKSIKWMILFFISSMLCIMAAFICAGITISPPIRKLKWSMIISLSAGGIICIIPLSWILWSLSQNRILSFIETRITHKVKNIRSDSSSNKSESSLMNQEQVDQIKAKLNETKLDPQGGGEVGEGEHEQANLHGDKELERMREMNTLSHDMEKERNTPSLIEEKSLLTLMKRERSMPSLREGDQSIPAFTEGQRSRSSIMEGERNTPSFMERKGNLPALTKGERSLSSLSQEKSSPLAPMEERSMPSLKGEGKSTLAFVDEETRERQCCQPLSRWHM